MLEGKLEKKYDFFEFNSELKIPKEYILNEKESHNIIETTALFEEEELTQYNNNLKIEYSNFIIKAPNKIILIFSIDKDLPVKVDKNIKNIFSISLSTPVLQVISFMHDSKNESIIISTGDSIEKIEVLQIEVKKLMHEDSYHVLNFIKNSLKIIPIKDSLALILHYPSSNHRDGGLKLWKNFEEEIYNFNKIYNFTYNFQYYKIICVDNKEAPFTLSVYPFDESYFSKNTTKVLEPEFFISLNQYIKNTDENEIELFLHFETFSNIICFWAKSKDILSGYILGIFFVNFKKKKCCDYIEIIFEAKNNYFFKVNANTNEIYIFNLSEGILYVYSFNKKDFFSSDDLYVSKINFCGNIKGVDFTENNGLVILTEQNNLVCYSKNEYIFNNCKKQFKDKDSILNNNINNSLSEDLFNLNKNINKVFNKNNLNFNLNKQKSEKIINRVLESEKNDSNDLSQNNKNNNALIENKKEDISYKEEDIKYEKNEEKKFNNVNNNINNNINNNLNKNVITIKLDSYTQTPKERKNKIIKKDFFNQTDEKKGNENEKENNFEIKEKINDEEESINKEKEEENKINETIENLEKKLKIYNEKYKIENKFKSTNNDKCLIIKLIKLYKEKINELENKYMKNISEKELNEIEEDINKANLILFENINDINKKNNNLHSDYYKDIDIILIKSQYYINETQTIISDIKYILSKILERAKNNDEMNNIENEENNNYNCNYESVDLINKVLKIELKDKNEIKDKIGKLINKCKLIDDKICLISEINTNGINIDKKYKYLLFNCLNEIYKINELYKYNKFKISKKEENEFIYGLINPFIEFLNKILKDCELKIDKLSKQMEQLRKNKNKNSSYFENKYLDKYEKNEEKYNEDNLEDILSNYFEEIYEENNFYSFNSQKISNNCIILEDEFKN